MTLQISQRVRDLGRQAQAGLREQFERIDAIAEENTARVLYSLLRQLESNHFILTTPLETRL